jgi:hypothetical protein
MSPPHPERVTATLALTTRLTDIPKSTLFRLLSRGQLRAVKNGRRTLVVWQSVIDYLDSLPTATFRASKAKASPCRIGLDDPPICAVTCPPKVRRP